MLEICVWLLAYFTDGQVCHEALRQFPDRREARANPCDGIASHRPETKRILKSYHAARRVAE